MGWASLGAKCLWGGGCHNAQSTKGEEDPALVLLPRVVMEDGGAWLVMWGVRWRVKDESEGWRMKEDGGGGMEGEGREEEVIGKGKGIISNFHLPQHCLHPRSHRLRCAGAAAVPAAGEEPGHGRLPAQPPPAQLGMAQLPPVS